MQIHTNEAERYRRRLGGSRRVRSLLRHVRNGGLIGLGGEDDAAQAVAGVHMPARGLGVALRGLHFRRGDPDRSAQLVVGTGASPGGDEAAGGGHKAEGGAAATGHDRLRLAAAEMRPAPPWIGVRAVRVNRTNTGSASPGRPGRVVTAQAVFPRRFAAGLGTDKLRACLGRSLARREADALWANAERPRPG